jgi:hypothetical protein
MKKLLIGLLKTINKMEIRMRKIYGVKLRKHLNMKEKKHSEKR